MSKIAVFFATGYEEIEALTVVDLCRRAKIEVDMVAVTGEGGVTGAHVTGAHVTGAHGISVAMDKVFEEVDFADYDMLVLPGGMPGTRNLEAHEGLMAQIDAYYNAGKYVAAICAAPSIFGHRGMLKGKKACCYPSFEEHLEGAEVTENPVEIAGNVITSRGMGTAMDLGLTIVELLCDEQTADNLGKGIVYK